MNKRIVQLIGLVFALAVLAGLTAAGAAAYQWWRYQKEPVVQAGTKVEFEIRKGAGAKALSPLLGAAGIDVQAWQLAVAWRLRGDADRVKAGRYALDGPITLEGVLDQLVVGQPDKERSIALIEGWNFRQVREALAKAPDLVPTLADVENNEVMKRLNAGERHPEGQFAPDTYAYPPGSTDLELLARALKLQQQRLQAAWQRREEGNPLRDSHQFLVLASIVEKESARDEDRPMIAAVFYNRLRLGMLLQSDPTTIYGIGELFDGNLKRHHLREDTPYNTYVRSGLTPTPIAMPGRGALDAVAQPAQSKALYFVARGDGTTEFSTDLAAHNRAVNRYQRKLR